MATTAGLTPPESLVEIWRDHPALTESKFWKIYLTRLQAGRDMHVAITAASETGVGKTALAYVIANIADINGWSVEQATLDPAEYAHLYDKRDLCEVHAEQDEVPLTTFEACDECEYYLPPGSWLIGDEWEQAVDARRSMTKENVEASHQVATKRYRQIFALYTLPSKSWMDDRFGEDAIDFWIQAKETEYGDVKGEAEVYRVQVNEHRGKAYTEHIETIEWPNPAGSRGYRELTRMKKRRMEGDIQRSYVHRDEIEDMKSNFWNKATKKTRYHMIKAMAEYGISQTDIAEITQIAEHIEGLSQPRVSQLVNTESFEDAYDG